MDRLDIARAYSKIIHVNPQSIKGPFIKIDQSIEEYLEQRSFENLVFFYQDELMAVAKGSSPHEFFKVNLCKKMRDLGILSMKGMGQKGRSSLIVTPQARRIMEGSDEKVHG